MATDDLVVWLRGQLDVDAHVAASAIQETGGAQWEPDDGGCCVVVSVPDSQRLTGDDGPLVAETRHWQNSEYIARHDPAFVLADIAAKRAVLAEVDLVATEHRPGDSDSVARCAQMEYVLRLFAAAYADRDGYRDEWRP